VGLMKEIIIYHTNDQHARVATTDDNNESIGLDKISKIVNKESLSNKTVFWFDGGDLIHGTPRINISQGQAMTKLLNPTRLNAFVAGNHEWNFGCETLLSLAKQLKAYMLSANIIKDGSPVLLPYIIYDIDINCDDLLEENSNNSTKDNLKMGIFGLTTPETMYKTNPNNIKGIDFLNPNECAEKMVKLLSSYCDIIIALTHLGLDKSSEFTSERLAREVSGIDIIVDGHSHDCLKQGMTINDTLIVQAGSHSHYLGKVTIGIDDKKIVSKKAEIFNEQQVDSLINDKTDTYIYEQLKDIELEADRILNKTIAYNEKFLSGDRLLVRREESELGNFTAYIFKCKSSSDIAIINGGSLRTSLQSGAVTRKDITAIFPFENRVQSFYIKGLAIRKMLEHSVANVPESFGGFLCVAGMTFTYDMKKEPYNRVSEIMIGSQLLDESKEYTICMTDFQAAGGDDFKMLMNLPMVEDFGKIEDIFSWYLNKFSINENDYKVGRIRVIS